MTFETRKTTISENHSLFQKTFHEDKNRIIQWKAFLRKAKLIDKIEFKTVMQVIKVDLEPIYKRIKNLSNPRNLRDKNINR